MATCPAASTGNDEAASLSPDVNSICPRLSLGGGEVDRQGSSGANAQGLALLSSPVYHHGDCVRAGLMTTVGHLS